ncbi:MAG: ankyrin repeat domain-containing protein [Candidatus Riflebacteria bacterium]|nr:ankyrin repeat domain-containing protein [Candidatus Riflebacteria bacterium]
MFTGVKAMLAMLIVFQLTMYINTLNAAEPDFNCPAVKGVEAMMNQLKDSPEGEMMVKMTEERFKKHPFILAIRFHRVDLVKALMEAGFDPKIMQSSDDYPLEVAVNGWSPGITTEVIELLLESGASPNVAGDENMTPLHHAATSGITEVVSLLMKHGGNPNLRASDQLKQMTPLHCAVRMNRGDIVKILLAGGGDPLQKNSEGVSPLDMAKAEKKEDLIKILAAKLPETESKNSENKTQPADNKKELAQTFEKAMNLAKQKKYSEAMPLFENCCSSDPENDNYTYYLALAQAKVDKISEAKQTCQKLLKRNPQHEKALKLLSTISENTK